MNNIRLQIYLLYIYNVNSNVCIRILKQFSTFFFLPAEKNQKENVREAIDVNISYLFQISLFKNGNRKLVGSQLTLQYLLTQNYFGQQFQLRKLLNNLVAFFKDVTPPLLLHLPTLVVFFLHQKKKKKKNPVRET
eukprot:TRINITY_DN38022_c0_g1_i2.p2 TRINITY_DN38022_c0_g1~~TRINITY_DN38022_c0_g1_i2.p2  ORF type:complete len:142 (-),score=5.80 TRINITY_DN38022_c0_g1_i2:225-629(-)